MHTVLSTYYVPAAGTRKKSRGQGACLQRPLSLWGGQTHTLIITIGCGEHSERGVPGEGIAWGSRAYFFLGRSLKLTVILRDNLV